MNKKVYVVHCVDAEGPLYESLGATFKRLRDFGVAGYPETLETLKKLQNGEIALGGKEDEIMKLISPERLNYIDSFEKLESMIKKATSKEFRMKYPDSTGQPYKFSWFILDFVGFKTNPRKRPEGYHVMWDWYHDLLRGQNFGDGRYWHFHTVPPSGEGTEYNNCWTNNDYPEQVLCRRILDKGWFPAVVRTGACIESLALSFWLEMFIPFDYSNSWIPERRFYEERVIGDWRNAPLSWDGYHPDFYDYRNLGKMKRKIFRCIEIDNGRYKLTEQDIIPAFEQASKGKTAVLAYSNHDRRDIRSDIEYMHQLLIKVSKEYSDVEWSYQNALSAARLIGGYPSHSSSKMHLIRKKDILWISADSETYSQIPFIALREKNGLIYRGTPLIEKANRKWSFKIRRPEHIDEIGVTLTYPNGTVTVEKEQF